MTKEIELVEKGIINRTLNFNGTNPIEILTLDELKQTYMEHNVKGEPMYNGIYHHDLIHNVGQLCKKHNLDYHVEEIFAAQNKRKGYDGVAVAPHIEKEYGENALQAHALRRVFTTIRINDMEDEESNTGLVISYHQDGLQFAIGPNVKACHNQCVLSAQRTVSNYGGEGKVKDLDKIFDVIDDWLHNFTEQRTYDSKVISQMKTIQTSYADVMQLIGRLNVIRVSKDSKNKSLKENKNLGKVYPLNQAQISEFTENYLLKCIELETTNMSLWDVYNISTRFFKPGLTDIPNIVTQNVAWAEFLIDEYKL